MVTLVDHHESIAAEQLGDMVAAGETLDHRDVHDPGRLGRSTAQGSDLVVGQIEERAEPAAPLVQEFLAVHDHQRRRRTLSDDCAGHHRLAGTGRRHDHTPVVSSHRRDDLLLLVTEAA